MIDEMELLRHYFESAPELSATAEERVRRRLQTAIASPTATLITRTRRPRRTALVAVVVTMAAAAVAIALVQTSSMAPSRPAALRWHLAGDIVQPAWHIEGSAGSGSYQLACPSKNDCYAAEPSFPTDLQTAPNGIVEASHDGGRSWQVSLTAQGMDFYGLSCSSATACLISGEDFESGSLAVNVYRTTDGGSTWHHQILPGAGSQSSSMLTCPSVNVCVVTLTVPGPGGLGLASEADVTLDGGAQWTTHPFPGTFRPSSLQCVGVRCVAVGEAPSEYIITNPAALSGIGAVVYSDDDGRTWTVGSVPAADMVQALSCTDALHCAAVEQSSAVVRTATGPSLSPGPVIDNMITTSDGGRTWTPVTGTEPDRWALDSVSCPTPLECLLVGVTHAPGLSLGQISDHGQSLSSFVKVTYDGGTTWTTISLPDVNGVPATVDLVACADPMDCFALAQDPTSPSGRTQRQLVLSTQFPDPVGTVHR